MSLPPRPSACALAAFLALAPLAQAQTAQLETVVVSAKREQRVSKGATGLPIALKDTPQSISHLEQEDMAAFGATGSNEALRLATGINVEQYETNRATFNSRGFEIQLTQLDGLGMSNDWGTVVGQLDTFVFERIELIRGANGLLTGVGNASGTLNYVRKRPLNQNRLELQGSAGSHDFKRLALDVNRRLSDDGAWAGRLVMAHEDKGSHLRALHDQRSTLYGVVDGQVGQHGVLTLGLTLQDAKQRSPMWGSLTLHYADGRMADFERSASTSQDWTFWNTRSAAAFAEYSHQLSPDWETKLTYTQRRSEEDVRLLYAYSPSTGALNPDNTGLIGWPYGSFVTVDNAVLDANLSGRLRAWGQPHSLIAGLSHSRQESSTDLFSPLTNLFLPLPAFPYAGNAYPEPQWGPRTPSSGEQRLTRFYAAAHIGLADGLKSIVGVNAIRLQRQGSSLYGNQAAVTDYPDTRESSPYLGLTYALSADSQAYLSYSDIFQNQDQTDINGVYLAPMKGVNQELGVKSEWFGKRLLTTAALFKARQHGMATYAGLSPAGTYYYEPKDIRSQGLELEASGRVGRHSRLALGLTRLNLKGPDGGPIYEWVPKTTLNARFVTRFDALPALELGVAARWQSDVKKNGGARQEAFLLAHGFAAYQLGAQTTLRLNVNNLFDKKYVGGLAYGAIYGAPRSGLLSLEHRL